MLGPNIFTMYLSNGRHARRILGYSYHLFLWILKTLGMPFGHGTWASIIAERNRRIQEAKAAQKKARIEARKRQEQLTENILIATGVFAAIGLFLLMIFIVTRI